VNRAQNASIELTQRARWGYAGKRQDTEWLLQGMGKMAREMLKAILEMLA
jgi:hypothetical protein